ncbi:MFS transporter [Longispora fulva]|uniref:MFS transporter n=1 Tax=Longispora fulva TaxID=619741 RepID=UPI0018C9DF0F|nr:MFS transporter [Longispora fulva]
MRPAAARRLRSLYAAVGVSSLGDGMFAAAVPLATAVLTRDPSAVALVGAAEMLPWLVVTPFAGALVDRWPHRATMIISDAARAVCMAALAVMIAAGWASVPALAVIAASAMVGYTFHNIAQQHVVADLTERDPATLHTANGRIGAAFSAGRSLTGPPAGSALFAWLAWSPFAVNAATFAASAALVATLPPDEPRTDADRVREPLLRSIASGAGWLARHRVLRLLCALVIVGNLMYAAALSTLVLYAQDVLKVSTAAYGFMLSAGAVGSIAINLVAGPIIKRLGELRTQMIVMAAQVIAWLTIAATTHAVVAAAALTLAYAGTGLGGVAIVGARQRLTPPDLLGRVVSAFRTFGTGASPLGAVLGGVLALRFGLAAPLWAAGIALAVATLVAAPVLLRATDSDHNAAP